MSGKFLVVVMAAAIGDDEEAITGFIVEVGIFEEATTRFGVGVGTFSELIL